jgi:hypothetical protein
VSRRYLKIACDEEKYTRLRVTPEIAKLRDLHRDPNKYFRDLLLVEGVPRLDA